MEKDLDFVTALARGLSILTCFKAGESELGNGQIARRSGLAPATVARLTHTLTQLGYLRSDAHRRKYALSANVLSISYPFLTSFPVRELARIHIKRLADEMGGAVCLGVLEGLQAVYIEVACSTGWLEPSDIGTRRPLLNSAVGRALFASMEVSQQESVLNRLTIAEPSEASELRKNAHLARDDFDKYGMCRTAGPRWSAIAMPVFGVGERQIAISLGVPAGAFDDEQLLKRAGTCLAATTTHIAIAHRNANSQNPLS